jgi:Na+/H+ antiporter NhaD/arsenite permease-like protein
MLSWLAPWAAIAIFLLMFFLIVQDKIERHFVTLGCGLAVLVLVFGICLSSWDAVAATLNVSSIFTLEFWYEAGAAAEETSGINWSTILFIAGMMVMVEGMAESGFFRWLCLRIAKLVHYRASRILLTFMAMSFVLAMFIDSITVILFLAAVTVELAELLQFNPVPVILSEIFCANLGGSATMCGDPPNIIIGTSLGLTFGDFVTNTGVIALISLIAVMIYFWFCFSKKLKASEAYAKTLTSFPDPKDAIKDKTGFVVSTMIFLLAVVMLVSHAQTGLTVAFIGVFIALCTLLAAGKKAGKLLRKIDYKTLLFFVGLFVVVGGLEQTGVLVMIADFIAQISGGNILLVIAIILWVSAIASAFVDNIPFAATMIPVIRTLAEVEGINLSILAWTLAMGTDIGGSATPIGASANVVGTAVAMKEGYPITWKTYLRYCVPATALVIFMSMCYIMLRYVLL